MGWVRDCRASMWLDPTACFEIRPSLVERAGDGIFAVRDIGAHSVFRIRHSRPRSSDLVPEGTEVFPLFLPPDVDLKTPCLVDGALTTLADAPTIFTHATFAHIKRSASVLMKANDLAWKSGLSFELYTLNCERNKLELILNFENGTVTTIAYSNRSISKGEEVGVTYGYKYWQE